MPEIISGYWFRSEETRALQDDDFENPAFLWIEQGEELWSTVEGSAGKSCETCHGDAAETMKGVRAHMPKWNATIEKPVNLEQQINLCRTEQMGAEAWKYESAELLSMTTFVGMQSRGMPIDNQIDGPMQAWFEEGRDYYYKRIGQLDMSCAHCHETNYGNRIRADLLSQGQSNGFPTYRLKWQGVGSLHRRFRGCNKQVRGASLGYGSDTYLALEIYLAYRGQGLSVETPAVRQ